MIFGIMGWTMIFQCAMIEVGHNHSDHSTIEIMARLLSALMRLEVNVKIEA